MAGTQEVWIPTEQTEAGWLAGHSGKGGRRRGEEFRIHPNRIKELVTGQAVVITPGARQPDHREHAAPEAGSAMIWHHRPRPQTAHRSRRDDSRRGRPPHARTPVNRRALGPRRHDPLPKGRQTPPLHPANIEALLLDETGESRR